MEINQIQQYIRKLPASYQSQVLDLVEYLVAKAEREAARREETAWSHLSLSSAMRGMFNLPYFPDRAIFLTSFPLLKTETGSFPIADPVLHR